METDDTAVSVVEAAEEENELELDVGVVTVSPAPMVEVVASVADIVVANDELEVELDERVLEAVVELVALPEADAVVALRGVTWPTGQTFWGEDSGPQLMGLQPGKPVRLPCTASVSTDGSSGQRRAKSEVSLVTR